MVFSYNSSALNQDISNFFLTNPDPGLISDTHWYPDVQLYTVYSTYIIQQMSVTTFSHQYFTVYSYNQKAIQYNVLAGSYVTNW